MTIINTEHVTIGRKFSLTINITGIDHLTMASKYNRINFTNNRSTGVQCQFNIVINDH